VFIKYRELGLSLIPIKAGEKRPAISEWQAYCERLPTEEEAEHWEETMAPAYGVALGPASDLIAIDIDSDDANVLAAVPVSPVRKRGRKGETRFFRYNPEIPSCKVAGCIDVLALGRQTVVPPTVHPETREPYAWLTPDTLENFAVSDLPRFTLMDLSDMRGKLEHGTDAIVSRAQIVLAGPFYNDDPKRLCPHGSHDRLKVIVTAMIARSASPDEVVRELLRYDGENHRPTGYFSDPTRAECKADPVTNALMFYASNLRTFNQRQIRAGHVPAVPLVSGSESIDVTALTKPAGQAWHPVPWPEPAGLLRDIKEQIRDSSFRDQPGLALGGAIAIASVAIANKLKLGRIWPNVYVLNIAPTGAGKSFPYDAAKQILTPENGLDLVGASGYRSSAALIKDLAAKRERLDLIDECSSFFKTIRDGGVFQSDMLDIVNALWSESTSVFLGPESMGRERVSVWHPCVSALFSTTPDGLKLSISREFMTQGLVPRCIIFHDHDYGPLQDNHWDEGRAAHIVECLQGFQKRGQVSRANIMAPRPQPDEIEATAGAQARLRAYGVECAERLAEKDREEGERHFLSRAAQQATKLALIHGALRGGRVEEPDVAWAIDVLKAAWHNAGPLFPQMGAENVQETNVMRVLHIIRAEGTIHHSRLIGKTRFLKTNERHEILASLEAEGKIAGAVNENRAKIWSMA
jgi:hypothetical protein